MAEDNNQIAQETVDNVENVENVENVDNVDHDSDIDENDEKIDDSDEVKLENGGVIKKILVKGQGWEKPSKGAEVFVHYVGTLEDGTKFDSSRDRNEPFRFKLGQGSVIKGWDVGIATMKKGEKANLICKPEFAYGSAGSPPKIPPDATLNFEVELISWSSLEKVTDDGKVNIKVTVSAEGWKTPSEFSNVTANISLRVNGKNLFREENKQLDVSDLGLPWGLVEGLKKMKKGQTAFVFVDPEYGYGDAGDVSLGVPPNAHLEYEISLIDFNNPKESWEMSKEEKVEHGYRLKEFGNAVFKKHQYNRAKKLYDAAFKLFQYEKDLTHEMQGKVNKLIVDCHANISSCLFTAKDYSGVLKESSEALKIDPSHTRSLYKRAQARAHLGDNEEALRDVQKLNEQIALKEEKGEALGVEKTSVETLAIALKKRISLAAKKEQKIFGGFFNKITLVTETENQNRKKEEADKDDSMEDTQSNSPVKTSVEAAADAELNEAGNVPAAKSPRKRPRDEAVEVSS